MDIAEYVRTLTQRAMGSQPCKAVVTLEPLAPDDAPTPGHVNAGQGTELPPVSDTRTEETIKLAAIDILNRAGARQFFLNGTFTVGLWAAADTPVIRHAISLLHPRGVQVLHLECAPEKYRRYKPAHLETEATRTPCDAPGVPFAEWKAKQLNKLFDELREKRR